MNTTPTLADLARSLVGDLSYLAQFERCNAANTPTWIAGWAAAARRALHAEAEVASLRARVVALAERVGGQSQIITDQCETIDKLARGANARKAPETP